MQGKLQHDGSESAKSKHKDRRESRLAPWPQRPWRRWALRARSFHSSDHLDHFNSETSPRRPQTGHSALAIERGRRDFSSSLCLCESVVAPDPQVLTVVLRWHFRSTHPAVYCPELLAYQRDCHRKEFPSGLDPLVIKSRWPLQHSKEVTQQSLSQKPGPGPAANPPVQGAWCRSFLGCTSRYCARLIGSRASSGIESLPISERNLGRAR